MNHRTVLLEMSDAELAQVLATPTTSDTTADIVAHEILSRTPFLHVSAAQRKR